MYGFNNTKKRNTKLNQMRLNGRLNRPLELWRKDKGVFQGKILLVQLRITNEKDKYQKMSGDLNLLWWNSIYKRKGTYGIEKDKEQQPLLFHNSQLQRKSNSTILILNSREDLYKLW